MTGSSLPTPSGVFRMVRKIISECLRLGTWQPNVKLRKSNFRILESGKNSRADKSGTLYTLKVYISLVYNYLHFHIHVVVFFCIIARNHAAQVVTVIAITLFVCVTPNFMSIPGANNSRAKKALYKCNNLKLPLTIKKICLLINTFPQDFTA